MLGLLKVHILYSVVVATVSWDVGEDETTVLVAILHCGIKKKTENSQSCVFPIIYTRTIVRLNYPVIGFEPKSGIEIPRPLCVLSIQC